MYRQWELTGRLPEQVCATLVVLLPKKEDIERPISLTSVLYRTWCKLRWDKLRQWQSTVGQRSMPGMQVLHVALMRLLKCEVGKATGRHVISLLLDLQCFYDSVELEILLKLWEPLDFPPAVLNAVYEVYSGPRLLQAEQVTSRPVHCQRGILAGCPVAPLIAKLVLAPVIGPFMEVFPRATVDVWVDDISVDFVGTDVHLLCREALDGYDHLRNGLEASGLQLSNSKTGYLTSSVECKKTLNLFRTDEQPRVHDLLKDLGLDSSGGRRRRIGQQQKRLLKGRGRHSKLLHLKLRSRPVRIRVWKTSVHAAAGYGLEAQGLAPQRMRTLRQQLARHGGLQKGGSVDIVFDQHGKLQDPKDTIVERQLRAMHQLVRAWPASHLGDLRTAWRISWKRLTAAAYPWMVVAGPMAALQAYLIDMGWEAADMDDWIRAPMGNWPTHQLNLAFPWPHLQRQLHLEQQVQRARRIQELEHCFPMMRKPDWTVFHQVMKKLKGATRSAVAAWTQGSLRTHGGGERAICPLCGVRVTMKHLIWECSYHEQPLPAEWQHLIQANEHAMLWARGLIEEPEYMPQAGMDSLEVHGVYAHGWPVRLPPNQRLAIGVHPTCKDGRVKRYAVALTAGTWQEGSWQITGACTCLAPGTATEARAWFYGCWLLLQSTLGRHQVNLAYRPGWAGVHKGAEGATAPDLWHSIAEGEWDRLTVLHVPPKMLKQSGADQRVWLQYQAARQCARARAIRDEPADLVAQLKMEDEWHKEVYEVAAERISAILTDPDHYMKDKITPVETAFKVSQSRPKGRSEILRQMVNRPKGPGEHSWQLKGHGIQCSQCGLHVKSCSTHAQIEAKQATSCPGEKAKTLQMLMDEMIAASDQLPDMVEGHRFYCKSSTFGCKRCWMKVARRCSKDVLSNLAATKCVFGPVDEQALHLRTRVHPQHQLVQRQQWLECQRCLKHTKIQEGRVQAWVAQECQGASSQKKLCFAPTSSSS